MRKNCAGAMARGDPMRYPLPLCVRLLPFRRSFVLVLPTDQKRLVCRFTVLGPDACFQEEGLCRRRGDREGGRDARGWQANPLHHPVLQAPAASASAGNLRFRQRKRARECGWEPEECRRWCIVRACPRHRRGGEGAHPVRRIKYESGEDHPAIALALVKKIAREAGFGFIRFPSQS